MAEKVVISVLGRDRPGIVATVSQILLEKGCNIEDVSQTMLQTEFAGIFIATVPGSYAPSELLEKLREGLGHLDVEVVMKALVDDPKTSSPPSGEPFVVTTMGSDRLGLVAGITDDMARFSVNITNLKAIFRGGNDPHGNTMIYEVSVPESVDFRAFRRELLARSKALGLELNLQHRDIFEAIHRV